MRKLASIQRVKNIVPIYGADSIELAHINDWQVVVKKGEFKINDLAIYFEIDSFLPIHPKFEFLRKSSYKKMGDLEGFRLKTIRLRGKLSQGLLLPVDCLSHLPEGEDVTDILGVLKYDPPIPACLSGIQKGNFPSFIPKTDEERIQNIYDKIDKMQLYFVTEKLDGSSATFYLNDDTFGVCSRNMELLESEGNTFWKVAKELKIEEKLRNLGKNIAIQGELIGEGIQGNKYNIKGHKVLFFNAYSITDGSYLSVGEFNDLIEILQLETVPIFRIATSIMRQELELSDLLEMAIGDSKLCPTKREGLVFRSIIDPHNSFKVINNEFLLEEKQ